MDIVLLAWSNLAATNLCALAFWNYDNNHNKKQSLCMCIKIECASNDRKGFKDSSSVNSFLFSNDLRL